MAFYFSAIKTVGWFFVSRKHTDFYKFNVPGVYKLQYFSGAFAIGDNSTTTAMQSFVDNGFRARFAGGYRLFTNSAANIGSFLNAGANSWATLSDVRLKENFLPVIGEDFLKKISLLPLTTWNYKTQDVKTFRHYGPMAQDLSTHGGNTVSFPTAIIKSIYTGQQDIKIT